MNTKMKHTQKLSYIALGGVLVLIGMITSSVFMPSLFALRDNPRHIECSSLSVVDENGVERVLLAADDLTVCAIKDNNGEIAIMLLSVAGTGGSASSIGLYNNNETAVSLKTEEGAGIINVYGKEHQTVRLGSDEHGNGVVFTWDKNGNRQ